MKYFTIKELCASAIAGRLGIVNKCNMEQEARLTALVDNVLDPLREWYGKPIIVNSGFRSTKLNKAVGGTATSQHMKGEAADITGGTKAENKKLFNYIKDNLPFDQLINESDFTWVHVSYKTSGDNRKQVLKL